MDKQKDLISVIITNYNYGMYITEAIESIFNQTYKNIELIVINDGSTDDSDAIIKNLIKQNPDKSIVYINRENRGVVYTRNEGIEVAKGKYISYLDADDFFNADYIEKSYAIAKETGADVVYPNWRFVGEWMGRPNTNFPEFTLERLQIQDLHCTPASLIKKSSIGKRRFEAEKVAEDWDFFIGLSLEGAQFKLAKDNYINYRVRSGTRSSQLGPDEDVEVFVEILKKYKMRYGEKVIEPQLIREKIDSIRNPKAVSKFLDVQRWRRLGSAMKRDGFKPTAARVAAKALSDNPVLWNSLGYVRNWQYTVSTKFSEINTSDDAKLAVVVHLYYPDRWRAIKKHLARIDQPFDLYISVQKKDKNIQIVRVSDLHQATNVIAIPNRGRDVLPFMVIAKKLLEAQQYDYILKLHSKKSLHREDGDEWIESLFKHLIPDTIQSITDVLSKPSTGIVGPAEHIVSLSRYMGGNRERLAYVINKVSNGEYDAEEVFENADLYPFFGGTMFWSRLDFFESIVKSGLRPIDFSTERGQVDATTAHALERFFGLAMHEICDKIMYSVDTTGKVSRVDKKKKYTDNYKYAD